MGRTVPTIHSFTPYLARGGGGLQSVAWQPPRSLPAPAPLNLKESVRALGFFKVRAHNFPRRGEASQDGFRSGPVVFYRNPKGGTRNRLIVTAATTKDYCRYIRTPVCADSGTATVRGLTWPAWRLMELSN